MCQAGAPRPAATGPCENPIARVEMTVTLLECSGGATVRVDRVRIGRLGLIDNQFRMVDSAVVLAPD